jgi:hypothetical protein
MAIQEITSGVGVYWNATKIKLNAMFTELYGFHTAMATLITTVTLTATGYITGKKVGIFAYLAAATPTTVTIAGTFYPLLGTFTKVEQEDFTDATTYVPGDQYSGTLTQAFEHDWHATVSVDTASATVAMTSARDGVASTGAAMETLCKTAGEKYHLTGTCVCELATGEEKQLMITSDGDGDTVTVHRLTYTVTEFYD